MENQENMSLELEQENDFEEQPKSTKKNLKWLWITLAIVAVLAIAVWCAVWAVKINGDINEKTGETIRGIEKWFSFKSSNNVFVIFTLSFIIVFLGYLLGRVSIKGITLGTAGVFLVAILIGFLCTLNFKDVPLLNSFYMEGTKAPIVSTFKNTIQNIGLILFVGAVGCIAGPNFFRDLKKNFKTYILLGVIIILVGTAIAVALVFITGYTPAYWSGVLSGALTSTPGYSAAKEAAPELSAEITLGHAIAYPFGVIGVVLFVQVIPKILNTNMAKERAILSVNENKNKKTDKKLFEIDIFGFAAFAIAIVLGLLLGSIKIPLTNKGYSGACFSLGTTGGVLIMCLLFGFIGKVGKVSLTVNENALKVLKEFGLVLFLLGAGFEGGVALKESFSPEFLTQLLWGFLGGVFMTLIPMIVGFIIAKFVLKLPLLNNLGSITGGMTSTPALGTLISVSGTDNVASAYASTYPIALILIVLASQLMITLIT